MAYLRRTWKRLTSDARTSVFKAVVGEIATHDDAVAAQLNAEYLRLASGSVSQAARLFVEDWGSLIQTYPDVGRLTCYLQREAERRSSWARVFLANTPLIAQSLSASVRRRSHSTRIHTDPRVV